MARGFAYAAPPPCLYPNDCLEMRDRIRQVRNYRKVLAAKRQAEYWRRRWESHPETMRSNLEALNRTRKEKAAERTQRLLVILSHLPAEIESWNLRTLAEEAIVKAGYTLKPGIHLTLLQALRRRSLISFDHSTLRWKVKVAVG